jgi:hypothetical protein
MVQNARGVRKEEIAFHREWERKQKQREQRKNDRRETENKTDNSKLGTPRR